MPRDCASCTATFSGELDRQMRSGVPLAILSAWSAALGSPISSKALGRHRRDHLALTATRGRRPVSDDFLESVRDAAADGLASGDLRATVKDGIAAQRGLDAREARDIDRDWQLRLVMALTGNATGPRVLDALDMERIAADAEYRVLLEAGA